MTRLKGKSVLITGGGSGIGLAIARLFLQDQARVVIAGRNQGKLDQAVQSLGGGKDIVGFAADVADPAQVERLVSQTTSRFGPVDILVNNAGTNIKERTFR